MLCPPQRPLCSASPRFTLTHRQMDDDDASDDSREGGGRQQKQEPQPSKNVLASAPLFWMREPIIIPASGDAATESTSGSLEDRLDPRVAAVLRGTGVDSLFSVQEAVLDAFKARSVHALSTQRDPLNFEALLDVKSPMTAAHSFAGEAVPGPRLLRLRAYRQREDARVCAANRHGPDRQTGPPPAGSCRPPHPRPGRPGASFKHTHAALPPAISRVDISSGPQRLLTASRSPLPSTAHAQVGDVLQALCSAVGLSCGVTHSEAHGTVEMEAASFVRPPAPPGWLSHGSARGLGGLLGDAEPESLIDVLVATPGR